MASKPLKLEGGRFARDSKFADEPLSSGLCHEKAAACLDEAARSQTPLNDAYLRQAQVWLEMAQSMKETT